MHLGQLLTLPIWSQSQLKPQCPRESTSLTDSTSTTTLHAAPATLHVSSRAPPPMPTIPEVSSTEVGSASWSRSPRDSPQTQSHIQPASSPQVSTNANILPPVNPYSLATFVPPPGIVDDTPVHLSTETTSNLDPILTNLCHRVGLLITPPFWTMGLSPMYPRIQSTRTFQLVQASFRVLHEKSSKDSQNVSRALRGNTSKHFPVCRALRENTLKDFHNLCRILHKNASNHHQKQVRVLCKDTPKQTRELCRILHENALKHP